MSKKFKSLIKFLFLIPIFCNLFLTTANAKENPPKINAESAILIDGDTGQVLYSKNANTKQFPASTTKILTALLVLENTKLTDIVTVGDKPPFVEGSSIGLKKGEKFTVETLLTGLLLESGNDCAEALAEHIAGSTKNFAKMMNERAKELGCKNSNFENPSGLPNKNHKTTAYDLALIMREVLKHPDYIRISRIVSKELPASNLDGAKRWVNNHDHLIDKNSKYYYPNALAGKSGYTEVSKHTFVISGKKDGRLLIAVFLKAEDKNKNFKDMKDLLEYGFNNFEDVKLYSKNQEVDNVKITNSTNLPLIIDKDVLFTANKSDITNLKPTLEYTLPKNIKRSSFKKGDVITKANVILNGQVISEVNLLSGIDRDYNLKEEISNNCFKITCIVIVFILLIILIIIRIIIVKNRKRK